MFVFFIVEAPVVVSLRCLRLFIHPEALNLKHFKLSSNDDWQKESHDKVKTQTRGKV